MKCFIGIDLGSTTTKAIFLDENEKILGRGITNSRSNYDLACTIAREEAQIDASFGILKNLINESSQLAAIKDDLIYFLTSKFKQGQYLEQLVELQQVVGSNIKEDHQKEVVDEIFQAVNRDAIKEFSAVNSSRSDFFRDFAAASFMSNADQIVRGKSNISFDFLSGLFDKSILQVENKSFAANFNQYLDFSYSEVEKEDKFVKYLEIVKSAINEIKTIEFNTVNTIGTGYGRQRLPFPKHQIRSEILCHGLGAHYMFPPTRTVLDIGGQDTKAIQIDEEGIVTSFQMNDRCAAGCGRYLGYIADEMNIGLHELGPLAMQSKCAAKINSTCTVFAGAELRERLAFGDAREDILAGLHRAIILRAMSLLARSGGIRNEFTFTGGVAKNQAATNALKDLVKENYGEMKINISSDSIYTGAVGAALFAQRDQNSELVNVDLSKLRKRAG